MSRRPFLGRPRWGSSSRKSTLGIRPLTIIGELPQVAACRRRQPTRPRPVPHGSATPTGRGCSRRAVRRSSGTGTAPPRSPRCSPRGDAIGDLRSRAVSAGRVGRRPRAARCGRRARADPAPPRALRCAPPSPRPPRRPRAGRRRPPAAVGVREDVAPGRSGPRAPRAPCRTGRPLRRSSAQAACRSGAPSARQYRGAAPDRPTSAGRGSRSRDPEPKPSQQLAGGRRRRPIRASASAPRARTSNPHRRQPDVRRVDRAPAPTSSRTAGACRRGSYRAARSARSRCACAR